MIGIIKHETYAIYEWFDTYMCNFQYHFYLDNKSIESILLMIEGYNYMYTWNEQ